MKFLKLFTICLALLLGSFESFSFVQVSTVTVSTSSPNDCSSTSITASGTLGATNYIYDGTNVSISGSTITVDVKYISGFIVLPAITPFSQTVSLGTLSAGTYTLIVRGLLSGTVSSTLTVSPSLSVGSCCGINAGFTSNATTFCIGDTVKLTDTSSASATSFYWYENGSLLDSSQNLSYVASAAGSYDIKLMVLDTCGSDTAVQSIQVLENPDFGPDTSICINSTLRLEVSSAWDSISWTGDAFTNFISVSSPGTYEVRVIGETGCVRTDSIHVSMLGTPLDLGPDVVYCPGDTAHLDAGIGWRTAIWSNGFSGPQQDVYFPATFYVTAVDSNFCSFKDTITVSASVFNLNVQGPDSICFGDTAQISVSGNWLNTQWSNGDTGSVVLLQNSGNYSVSSMSIDSCVQNITFDLVVIDYPITSFVDTSICEGDSFLVDVTQSNSSYLWNDLSTNPQRSFSANGIYSVKITKASLCSIRDSFNLSVYTYPVVDLGADDTLCIGDSVFLDSGNPFAVNEWQDGSGNYSFIAKTSGVYYVNVSHFNLCSTTDTIVLSFIDCDSKGSTGLIDLAFEGSVKIYPNPSPDILSVEIHSSNDRAAKLIVSDLQGRQIMFGEIVDVNLATQLDVSGLQSGMYFLSVEMEDQIETLPFYKK